MEGWEKYRLDELTIRIAELDAKNPLWRESFDQDFMAAIYRALSDYAMLQNMKPDTAAESDRIQDATLYVAMSIYTSIERVINRKRVQP